MEYRQLVHLAAEAKKNAYNPYSGYSVGAALVSEDGTVFTGCNIENIAYPSGICAERVAFSKAISEGFRKFKAIAIIGSTDEMAYPCGMCRQFMAEFVGPEFVVICANKNGEYEQFKFSELLPNSFSAKF
ncbi:MAG TPA: cytidine deaminase [Clostridiaceae bacterium]|nr:cytidine deaminase [Clostridiaceae bacterium]